MKTILTTVVLLSIVLMCALSVVFGQSSEGNVFFERALELQQKAKSKDDLERSLEMYGRALDLFAKTGPTRDAANALNNMALIHRSFSQYGKALELCDRGLSIFRNMGDAKGEAMILNSMASVYHFSGYSHKSIELCTQALTINKAIGNVRGQANDLGGLGAAYDSLGLYHKVLETNEAALSAYSSLGEIAGQAVILGNLGVAYSKLGQYHRSTALYERSADMYRQIGDLAGESIIINNSAANYWRLGQHRKAIELFDKCLGIEATLGKSAQHILANKADVYLDMGETALAEAIFEKMANPRGLGRLALMRADFETARLNYQKMLDIGKDHYDADYLFGGHVGLAQAYEGLREFRQAADHYAEAVILAEETRDSLPLAERKNFYDGSVLHFRRIEPFEGLSRVLLLNHDSFESLRWAESTKARLFAEVLAQRAGASVYDIPADIRNVDSKINETFAVVLSGLQKAREKGSHEAVEQFEQKVKKAREERDAHISRLRREYPLFAATKYPQPMDLRDSALRDDEWIIEYVVTDTGVGIFLIKGKKIVRAVFRPIERKTLDDLVRAFREPFEGVKKSNLTEKLKSFNLAAGKKLSDHLLGDILSDLPEKTPVAIVPDGSLGILPFEMIVLSSSGRIQERNGIPCVVGAEFFGDRNPISYYQSITALTLARTLGRKRARGDKLIVIADPVFQISDPRAQGRSSDVTKLTGVEARLYKELMADAESGKDGQLSFERLPLTEVLARNLAELYEKHAEIYTGFDASKDAFFGKIAPHLDQYRDIVFATHGYFSKDSPVIREPVIVLTCVPHGTDGYLRMSEVTGLKVNADTVVLTACQTGLGRNISGEGTMGMGRAFQYAGARSVMMSLWAVAVRTSVHLTGSFFQHRRAGKGKLEALKLARKEIRDSGFDHPYFWAPFILVGEIDAQPDHSPSSSHSKASSSLPPETKVASRFSQATIEKTDTSTSLVSSTSPVSAKDQELLRATKESDLTKVKRLLSEGANIGCTDAEYGATPLHWASYSGHQRLVALLLDRGAVLNAKNNDGRTPLIVAAGLGHIGVVKMLIRHKADKAVKDANGKTALDWARDKNHSSIVNLLKK